MADHYVRHLLRPGDYARTEFQCRAPEQAPCRVWCKTCSDEQREQCECEWQEPPREPNLVDHGVCNIVTWLSEDAPEECYNGEEAPVRGPDWQPIVPEWSGDNWDWDYEPASELSEDVIAHVLADIDQVNDEESWSLRQRLETIQRICGGSEYKKKTVVDFSKEYGPGVYTDASTCVCGHKATEHEAQFAWNPCQQPYCSCPDMRESQ